MDVTVRNAGKVTGDDVAQVYLSFPSATGMPMQALRAVRRVTLAAGKRRALHFQLSPSKLSSVTQAYERIMAVGAYRVTVGGGQAGSGAPVASTGFAVTGQAELVP